MAVNDVLSGYENEDGVYLNIIIADDGETVTIDARLYEPDHEDFAWAVEQLAALQQS